jgi:hypothetical protein
MTAGVVRGTITSGEAGLMPTTTLKWAARFANANSGWGAVADRFTIEPGAVAALDGHEEREGSSYGRVFRQGAILVPRMALFVKPATPGPLSPGAGRIEVESLRSAQEDKRWKTQLSLSGVVEVSFVRDVHLGATIGPFRALTAQRAVLPLAHDHILTPTDIELEPDLAKWWANVEQTWASGRVPSETKPLLERMDYHRQLSAQLPATRHRVGYSASGSNLAAARVGQDTIIEHSLYWGSCSSLAEARYLVGVLNSQTLLERIRRYQNVGLFGPRHFDKYVWIVPTPVFDPRNAEHRAIADIAAAAEATAAAIEIPTGVSFRNVRLAIWKALKEAKLDLELESAVQAVLP